MEKNVLNDPILKSWDFDLNYNLSTTRITEDGVDEHDSHHENSQRHTAAEVTYLQSPKRQNNSVQGKLGHTSNTQGTAKATRKRIESSNGNIGSPNFSISSNKNYDAGSTLSTPPGLSSKKYTKNNSSNTKRRDNNKNRNYQSEQVQKVKDIDINMYEYQVLSFHQRMMNHDSNIIESISDRINMLNQFLAMVQNLSTELIDYCSIMSKEQKSQLKQQKINGIEIVDRAFYCLVKGLNYLDIYWNNLFGGNEINAVKKQEETMVVSTQHDPTLRKEINSLWNKMMEILEHISNYGAKSAKKNCYQFHHSHDCYVILIDQMTSSYDFENEEMIILSTMKNHMKLSKAITLIKSLKLLIKGFGYDLNGEKNIGQMVESVLLPILEIDLLSSHDNIHIILALVSSALDCIVEILVWKNHAFAILSALVVNVGSTGQEHLYQNPLRVRLIRSLIGLLNCEEFIDKEHGDFLCSVCQVLYTSLDKMYAMEFSPNNKNKTEKIKLIIDHIEVASVFKWVHKYLQTNHSKPSNSKQKSLLWHNLRLLESITNLYPKGCAQFWALFLPQSVITPKSSYSAPTTLITIINDGDVSQQRSDEDKIMATRVCKEFIASLPLNLWSKSGYLMNRVETSLLQLIICFREQISKKQSRDFMNVLCLTAGTLITDIPYNEYKSLNGAAESLLNQIGNCYIENDSLGKNPGCIHTFSQVLTDCFGGKETPQGDRTPLPIPTENWLRGSSSHSFIHHVFSILQFIDPLDLTSKCSVSSMKVTLVTRMVRAVAWVVLDNEDRLTKFVSLSQKLLNSDSVPLKLTGVQLLGSFLEGKKNIEQISINGKIGTNSMYTIYSLLSDILKVNESKIRFCTLSAFGHFQYMDLLVLLNQQPSPIQLMLPICLENSGDKDRNVRSQACRTLGNIVTVCLESYDYLHHDDLKAKILKVVLDTILVTASAVEDSNAAVRSMALFAMGNIALQVGKLKHLDIEFVQKLPLLSLSKVTFKHLLDSDDKVVGNAIRTLGHLCNLLYNHNFELTLLIYERMTWAKLCGQISFELSNKIELAVTDVTDSLNQRSWRQRSLSKRHAWGSCQALASVLCCDVAKEEMNRFGVKAAILSLIKCVRCAQLMNEKIVHGALSTLKMIPGHIYMIFADIDNIIGKCFSVCVIEVERESTYQKSIFELMNSLLGMMNYYDFVSCLNIEELSESNVESLYFWMVSNEAQAINFDHIARAFEVSPFKSNISLLQKFQSRAEMKRRNENIAYSQDIASDEDDEDEL